MAVAVAVAVMLADGVGEMVLAMVREGELGDGQS